MTGATEAGAGARGGRASGLAAGHRRLALFFLAVSVIQFFIAGLGVFGDGDSWDAHRAVGSGLTIVALVLVVVAFAGRREALPASLALFVLMLLQTFLAVVGDDVAVLGALHPVNGLLLLGVAMLAAAGRPLGRGHAHGS